MSRTFLISDTHFGHKNIIKYCDRPFVNVEEMEMHLVLRWADTVSADDTVIHLGDFVWRKPSEMERITKLLPGRKILLWGNHDDFTKKQYLEAGFEEVAKSKPLEVNGQKYLLTHLPVLLDEHLGQLRARNVINVHGHIHDKLLRSNMHINVSVEHINYTPILVEELPRIQEEQMASESEKKYHLQRYKEGFGRRDISLWKSGFPNKEDN